jgi:EAL domain-containing protein (putative c-di-GMP-specific phosphodiesterase class I)
MRSDSTKNLPHSDAARMLVSAAVPTPAELERKLQERIKELNLLHASTRLLQGKRLTLQVVLTELAALLPPAWQYPDVCQARISYGGTTACTPFWCDSPWKMSTAFTTRDGRSGVIEVVYLQQTPLAAEGAFLNEERNLIDSMAELLVAHLERRAVREDESSTDLAELVPQDIALMGDVADAIERNQLVLHYQPKVDLRSGHTVGVEALVRWKHPVHGLIYPDRFVLLAESAQLINALTHWVLQRALQQWHGWTQQGVQLGLSLNLSASNLADRTLVPRILELAKVASLPLNLLTLEITESTVMAEPARAKRVMNELHDRGVQFTMEDFGTGQSSPTYLKDLPIGKMKIDKSFVMDFNADNAAIVRDAIELGHELGMQITAEGVEKAATRNALQKLGCDLGQGYLFAKPMPETRLLAWLRKSRWGYPSEGQD